MSDNLTQLHQPLTQADWSFIFDVLEGTKLDVPRIRSEVARLHREAAQSELERLRADNAALRREAHTWWSAYAAANKEIEQWRRAVQRCVSAWTVVRGGVWDPNGLMDEHIDALRKALRPQTPVGWSDSEWIAHLEQLRQKAEAAYAKGPLPERGWD
jgi:hypothetical protein